VKNNINPKLITMNRQTNEDLRNYYQILNKDQVKVFYLTQIHDNICEIIWKLYLERYPNTEIPSKPTFKQKMQNEAILEFTGMTHQELNILKKVRGNSDTILKLMAFFRQYDIPFTEIFFEKNLFEKCLHLV
jgi:uncharacterized pyridoxamine 5'-phosphate oxidase family protein